jgi:hypothetical protein
MFSFGICFCGFGLIDFSTVAELSPPPEPFEREMCPWAISKYFGD